MNLSTQELYLIYLDVKKNHPKLTFLNFFKLFISFYKNQNTLLTGTPSTTLLSFLYFFKTSAVVRVVVTRGINHSANSSLFTSNGALSNTIKFNGFWKKFQKLKRPSTEKNFNEYFLLLWEKKFSTYTNLGFLKTLNNFYISGVSNNLFALTSVQTNKPLLSAPKFSSTSINKFLSVDQLNNFEFQFLRKNKVYNKGRYSRCRQNYRTGVYMCMYLSVCSIFGLYYWFYKFTFNFSYLWWFFIAFFASFLFPKIVKYRLYEPTTLLNKFFDFFKWLFALVRSLFL
jgi:hypothetical protein